MRRAYLQILRVMLLLRTLLLTIVSAKVSIESIKNRIWTNEDEAKIDGFFSTGGHTNNWAVLVDTSRFWLNYRHIANTLSIYRTVKRLGIPDSNIILMLADDIACNSRNSMPGTVFNSYQRKLDLYGDNIEVDYRGYDVNVANFVRVLTGRVEAHVSRSKKLMSDDRSNVLIYLTGHGGEDFLKFQDNEELGAQDLADAFAQMWEKRRYHELMFMIDTCQASSMFSRVNSPNVVAASSSRTGEPSYSHHADNDLGVAVIDRFTYYNLETFEKMNREDTVSVAALFNTYDSNLMHSHPILKYDKFQRPLDKTLVTDFFGGVQSLELTEESYLLDGSDDLQISHPEDTKNDTDDMTRIPVYKMQKVSPTELFPVKFWVGVGLLSTFVLISFY